MKIASNEIILDPRSYVDPSGRLFWWNGHLYRAITAERAPLYRHLFSKGIVRDLIEKNRLVPTELTSLEIDGYEMVLRHRLIPFVSYASEWCAEMLKDVALLILNLEMELTRDGLTLQDANPWNVLFDGCRPCYVDFGSIVPADTGELWRAHDEFSRFFIHPLKLFSHGHGRIARWLLRDNVLGVLKSDLASIRSESLGFKARQRFRGLSSFAKHHMPDLFRAKLEKGVKLLKAAFSRSALETSQPRLEFLREVRQEVESITISPMRTEWSNDYESPFPAFSPTNEWTAKHHSVFRVLSNLKPLYVLDIGSNRGWYSQLAAIIGSQVVSFDVDEETTTQLYRDAKEKDLPIQPLIMDFTYPTPGSGVCYQWFLPAYERLACDMVLALGLSHRLVFKDHLDFKQIACGLSNFSKKSLLVEFVPREDQFVREWWSERFQWYTLDNFKIALQEEFRTVTVLPSHPEPRVLLLCEKPG